MHRGCRDPRICSFQTATDGLGLDGKPRPHPGQLVIVRDNQETPEKCIKLLAASLTPTVSNSKFPEFGNGLKTQRRRVADQIRFI